MGLPALQILNIKAFGDLSDHSDFYQAGIRAFLLYLLN